MREKQQAALPALLFRWFVGPYRLYTRVWSNSYNKNRKFYHNSKTGVIVSVSLRQTSSTACIFPSLFSIWEKKDDIFNHFSDVYVL